LGGNYVLKGYCAVTERINLDSITLFQEALSNSINIFIVILPFDGISDAEIFFQHINRILFWLL
jgi:hypothetical protein